MTDWLTGWMTEKLVEFPGIQTLIWLRLAARKSRENPASVSAAIAVLRSITAITFGEFGLSCSGQDS